MYAQVEKTKENKNRAVANDVGQKKSNEKQEYGFVNKRSETVAQRKLHEMIQNSHETSQIEVFQKKSDYEVIQRKYDHLFNDIPKSLSNLPSSLKSGKIEEIRTALNILRDDHSNGIDDLHVGTDQNAIDFGLAQRSFLTATAAYASSQIDERGMREATFLLWKYSVDNDVANSLGNVSGKVKQWHSLEKITWEALTRHTGIDE